MWCLSFSHTIFAPLLMSFHPCAISPTVVDSYGEILLIVLCGYLVYVASPCRLTICRSSSFDGMLLWLSHKGTYLSLSRSTLDAAHSTPLVTRGVQEISWTCACIVHAQACYRPKPPLQLEWQSLTFSFESSHLSVLCVDSHLDCLVSRCSQMDYLSYSYDIQLGPWSMYMMPFRAWLQSQWREFQRIIQRTFSTISAHFQS
jgi:hypothetical protein